MYVTQAKIQVCVYVLGSPLHSYAETQIEGFAIEILHAEDPTVDTVRYKEHEDIHGTTSTVKEAADHSALELESLLPESPQLQKISFDLVPFSSTSLDFDNKYASHGRYAFSLHNLPKDLMPSERISHASHVPHFGVIEMGGSPVKDNMDIGMFMLRYANINIRGH